MHSSIVSVCYRQACHIWHIHLRGNCTSFSAFQIPLFSIVFTYFLVCIVIIHAHINDDTLLPSIIVLALFLSNHFCRTLLVLNNICLDKLTKVWQVDWLSRVQGYRVLSLWGIMCVTSILWIRVSPEMARLGPAD